MTATGIERQERKMAKLTEVVLGLEPGLEALPVKGALRMGIDAALRELGLASWKEVADKSLREKRAFFDVFSGHALKRLERIGFPAHKAEELAGRLRRANESLLR